MIYYIDNAGGSPTADGKSPDTPVLDYTTLTPRGGDTLLFRCGNVYRTPLVLTAGEEGKPITYGAYGDGDMPTFTGGTAVGSPDAWIPTERENVWLCTRETNGCVGNLVFNGDECTATLRWTLDDLSAQGDFFDERYTDNCFRQGRPDSTPSARRLYMYSLGNPAEMYSDIAALDYSFHWLCELADNVVLDGLRFRNNSAHGIAGSGGKNVTIRNCSFENIGGIVWNYKLRIRFGNALEFWDIAENILVENCRFRNVYDSCITHQGPGAKTHPAVSFNVRDCRFDSYGMAAFEYRDRLPIASSFTCNVCLGAGTGFAMLGEDGPRRSEIWPQPMGHHIFLWRIEDATDGGSLLIEDNTFGDAPVGAAIYSIINERAEAQITLRDNRYTRNDTLLVRFGGEDFTDLTVYKQKSGKDEGSSYLN